MAKQIDIAEAQLRGWAHAAHGYSLKDLVESMGLKKSEWIILKETNILNSDEKQEVDEYFEKQKK